MARPLRVQFSGALYHVTARGDERKPIFRDKHDRPVSQTGLIDSPARVRKYLSQCLSADAQARSTWRSSPSHPGRAKEKPTGPRLPVLTLSN
jgi:hypothetical protein